MTHGAEKLRLHRKKHDEDGLNSPETSTGSTTVVHDRTANGEIDPPSHAVSNGAPAAAPPAGQSDGGDVVHRDLEQGMVDDDKEEVQQPEMNMPVTIVSR